MIECDTVEQINALVAAIVEAHGAGSITVIRVKNRFRTPSAGGWRDIMINFIVAGFVHICELQIVHSSVYLARAGLPGHDIYNCQRNAQEMLDLLEAGGLLSVSFKEVVRYYCCVLALARAFLPRATAAARHCRILGGLFNPADLSALFSSFSFLMFSLIFPFFCLLLSGRG